MASAPEIHAGPLEACARCGRDYRQEYLGQGKLCRLCWQWNVIREQQE